MHRIVCLFTAGFAGGSLLLAQSQPSPEGWRRIGESHGIAASVSATVPSQAPAPTQTANPPASITIPAGSFITVQVGEPISSNHNKSGEPFSGLLTQPLTGQGFVLARRGQMAGGRIVEAIKGSRVHDTRAELRLELTDLTLANGQQVPVHTQLVQHQAGSNAGQDALTMGTAIGMGAAVGAAAGGGLGAGIGAAAGAVVSAVAVLATPGKQAVIHPEDVLTFRTVEPITISTEGGTQAFQQARPEDYAPRPPQQYSRQYSQPYPPQRRAGPPPPPPYYYPPYPYGYYPYPYYGPGIVIYGGRYRRW